MLNCVKTNKNAKGTTINPQPPRASGDALSALRIATAERHTVLDTSLPLAVPAPGLAHYRQHLRILRAWLAPLECWLAGFDDGPQGESAPPPLLRTPLIDVDLADPALAGLGPGQIMVERGGWPPGASAAYRWGVCYVIEGSQLGGAVLYHHLAEALAPHPLRYLQSDEAGPGPRWRAFIQALRGALTTPQQIEQACAGACDAFDRILQAPSLTSRWLPG